MSAYFETRYRDAVLTQVGMRQAIKATALLRCQGLSQPDQIWVSPMRRAIQTANLMFPNAQHKFIADDRLLERQGVEPCCHRLELAELQQSEFGRMIDWDHSNIAENLPFDENQYEDEGVLAQRIMSVREVIHQEARQTGAKVIVVVSHHEAIKEVFGVSLFNCHWHIDHVSPLP